MSTVEQIKVPDIGEFTDVDVIEVLVSPGDAVAKDQPLITLESDKAAMEVPAPVAGVVEAVHLQVGAKVSEGSPILAMRVARAEPSAPPAADAPAGGSALTEGAPVAVAGVDGPGRAPDRHIALVVLGSGPGGYSAAFRAADLGMDVALIERDDNLGGVCLNVGCIPSKALLHVAKIIDEAKDFGRHGLKFAPPEIDLDGLRGWKDKVVKRLTGGLDGLAKRRKVNVVRGVGRFVDAHHLEVDDGQGSVQLIRFDQCIIAAGSEPIRLPFMPADPRVVDSTGALEIPSIPKRFLCVGGGIIGLEMATVYSALGSQVSVVELTAGLMAGADPDIVKPFHKRIQARYERIMLETRVTGVEAREDGLYATFEGKHAPAEPERYDMILVAVGRRPNGDKIGAERAGVHVDARGFIPADKQLRTNVSHIFAIGDIIGQPMLAHKAVHEGKVAAEVAAGHKAAFDAKVIPSVAYTDPEVAWAGLTETEAKVQGIDYGKGSFPWAASGRSLAIGREEGVTKLLFDKATNRIIGVGIVGPSAGDLIAEAVLAMEMGADASDIGLSIHPHPTLSETVGLAAEMFDGTITDLYVPKRG